VHVRVAFDAKNNQWSITDCNSSNGTYVNGQRIHAQGLPNHSVIRVGDCLLLFSERAPQWLEADTLVRIASSNLSVLIRGDAGVGKEFLAKQLHQTSQRGEFFTYNCAVGNATQLERSLTPFLARSTGTLFLDAVDELDEPAQASLLQLLEASPRMPPSETTPGLRVLASTSRPLDPSEAAAPKFRADLLARLAQIRLDVPPLKRRRQEILPLLHQLVADRELALPVGAAEALLTWHWPQNVRELETLGRAYAVLRKPARPTPTTAAPRTSVHRCWCAATAAPPRRPRRR
jgi:DNA-binding NtrC family response regulator